MNNNEYIDHISHLGIVTHIDSKSGEITVRLTDADDCGSCPAAAVCSISGKGNDDSVKIYDLHPGKYKVGEKVRVVGTEQMHRKAILLTMVIPCVAMLLAMVAIWYFTASQAAAALGGLGVTIFFFVLLYLMKNRIRHEFRFSIEKAERGNG